MTQKENSHSEQQISENLKPFHLSFAWKMWTRSGCKILIFEMHFAIDAALKISFCDNTCLLKEETARVHCLSAHFLHFEVVDSAVFPPVAGIFASH